MDHHELHVHVAAAALATQPESLRGLSARLVAYCWPGGHADRYNQAALSWVLEWGPMRTGASVPVCSCASGHCDICN